MSGFKIVTEKFLASAKPEVLCVRGAWGVGKTFAWKNAVANARTAATMPLDDYAYVSLFGINNLKELKQSIFDNTVVKKSAGLDASLETLEDFIETSKSVGKRFFTRAGAAAANTGALSKFVGNIGPALFLSVRDRMICIDDLERRGEKLKVSDVLGLISMLKEQRACKIVLLLNEKAIKEEERKDFDAYLEKVVDVSFHFNPSPEDSSRIAFPDQAGTYSKIAERCTKLGIKNIRILGKIRQFIDEILPNLKDFDSSVVDQAISTVVFLCWVVYDPTNAPDLKYLRERTDWDPFIEERRKQLTPEMMLWEQVLRNYGFGHIDALDNALLDGIQNGLFDKA